MRDRVLPDQIHNFAHNNEWLTRSMRHAGRMHDAIDLAKNMIELPRHPQWNTLEKRGGSASYGRRRLLDALEQYEQWSSLVELTDTMYLEPSEKNADESARIFMLGEALAFLGEYDAAREQVEVLKDLVEREKEARSEAVIEAEEEALEEEKKSAEVRDAMAEALEDHEYDLRRLRQKVESLEGLLLVLETEPIVLEEAVEVAVAETGDEDEVSEPSDPRRARPTKGRRNEAGYEGDEDGDEELRRGGDKTRRRKSRSPSARSPSTTRRSPKRSKALGKGPLPKEHLSRSALAPCDCGRRPRSSRAARPRTRTESPSRAPTWPTCSTSSASAKKPWEVFEELRPESAQFDLDAPAFERLAPLAAAADLPQDWRVAYEQPEDVAGRPDPQTLGPGALVPPVGSALGLPGRRMARTWPCPITRASP